MTAKEKQLSLDSLQDFEAQVGEEFIDKVNGQRGFIGNARTRKKKRSFL
ncbi:TPA: hypothetical protein JAJ32_003012 [Legionella pneumophila]|nr:hypothetical protein [Legionella pneumophila]WBV62229.1 hypothetical protein PGH43_09680 [Legionella pneumophila 130b]AGH54175.1 hypothetical protein LPE509_02084 [Legionella pneumophila subsp. pneumophila LPE509]MCK0181564.1 hypothetical protein [Legionella pneumophila]MCK1861576.1 hypothetical protein [Legionella pneumophila]MCK1869092.1 hypothetical protein [Legionella pneumophila]